MADKTNQTKRAITALTELEDVPQRIILVLGQLFNFIDEIENMIKSSKLNIDLHINTKRMPALMAQSDLAITSGSLTVWELACLGVPNIIISTSERERENSLLLDRDELCYYIGHYNKVDVSDIAHATQTLIFDRNQRREMAIKFKDLVDGHGTQRVIQHILSIGK
jgi:spore coat polysaccharide biosynthesis predicted glycosyltransferase SpsG